MNSRSLLSELDRALYNMFLLREKVSELSARIDWLHDDFTTELNSLVQDFTWQQGTLLDQIASRQGDTAQYLKRSREVQNEQQQVYTLARIENQIVEKTKNVGSISFVPPVAGMLLASEVIKDICEL